MHIYNVQIRRRQALEEYQRGEHARFPGKGGVQKSSMPRPERRELGCAVVDELGREGMWCGRGFGHRPAVLIVVLQVCYIVLYLEAKYSAAGLISMQLISEFGRSGHYINLSIFGQRNL